MDSTPALVLLVVTLAAFWPLLLSPIVTLDGWFLDRWQRDHDMATLRQFSTDVGMPYLYFYHRAFTWLPGFTRKYHYVTFASLYLSSVCIYILAWNTGLLAPVSCLFISALFLTYPGNKMLIEKSVSQYAVLPAMFFLASVIATSISFQNTLTQALAVLVSLALFFVSFNMNSLLVFYFIFVLYRFLLDADFQWKGQDWLAQHLAEHGLFLVLPFAFWLVKKTTSKPADTYRAYNNLRVRSLTPKNLVRAAYNTLMVGVFGSLCRGLAVSVWRGNRVSQIVVAACMFGAVAISEVFGAANPFAEPPSFWVGVLAFGVAAVVLASLPYILTANPFALRGWGTKNNALLGLPYALLTIGGAPLILRSTVAYTVILFVITVGAAMLNRSQFYWIANYLKWISVRANIQTLLWDKPHNDKFGLLLLRDELPVDWKTDGTRQLHTIQSTCMLAPLLTPITCLVVPAAKLSHSFLTSSDKGVSQEEIDEAIRDTTVGYSLAQIEKAGNQCLLVVSGDSADFNTRLVVTFLVNQTPFGKAPPREALSRLSRVTIVSMKRSS
jgi:hypothetical protein